MSARVKHFLSALLLALREERHFALMDGVAFPYWRPADWRKPWDLWIETEREANHITTSPPRLILFLPLLLAGVLSELPWYVPCNLHVFPTSGVGDVWWGYRVLTFCLLAFRLQHHILSFFWVNAATLSSARIVATQSRSESLRTFFRARFLAKACFTRRLSPGFR
jgi:hypothetical protein